MAFLRDPGCTVQHTLPPHAGPVRGYPGWSRGALALLAGQLSTKIPIFQFRALLVDNAPFGGANRENHPGKGAVIPPSEGPAAAPTGSAGRRPRERRSPHKRGPAPFPAWQAARASRRVWPSRRRLSPMLPIPAIMPQRDGNGQTRFLATRLRRPRRLQGRTQPEVVSGSKRTGRKSAPCAKDALRQVVKTGTASLCGAVRR